MTTTIFMIFICFNLAANDPMNGKCRSIYQERFSDLETCNAKIKTDVYVNQTLIDLKGHATAQCLQKTIATWGPAQ